MASNSSHMSLKTPILSSTTDSQVSWPSCYWALVPLALGAMTQPCGSIYGIAPLRRTYLRISPVVCAADALSAIIDVSARLIKGSTIPEAARLVMHSRTAELHDADEVASGLQAMENMSIIRLILFVVGTLPQAIKILACRGIPLTQACVGMYMASICIFELIIALAQYGGSQDERFTHQEPLPITEENLEMLNRQNFPAEPTPQSSPPRWPNRIGTILVRLALVLHGVILCIAFGHIVYQPLDTFMESALVKRYSAKFPITPVWAGVVVVLIMHPYLTASFSAFGWRFATVAYIPLATNWMAERVSILHEYRDWISAGMVVYTHFLALWTIVMGMLWVAMRSRTLRRQVFGLPDGALATSPAEERHSACATLAMFMLTVATTTVWYALRFNPTGTYKPNWTNALG